LPPSVFNALIHGKHLLKMIGVRFLPACHQI
jgi:hypothetical protein